MSKVVFTFGRMNPPTIGHQKLVDKVEAIAKKEKALETMHSPPRCSSRSICQPR